MQAGGSKLRGHRLPASSSTDKTSGICFDLRILEFLDRQSANRLTRPD
jgi:hypothetical protein